MPAKKKTKVVTVENTVPEEILAAAVKDMDLDALLVEMGFVEPERVSLKWRGREWSLKPVNTIDPRLLAQLGTLKGIIAVLKDGLGVKDFKVFPMPRGVDLPNGKTEIEFFLDCWSDLSDGASSGE